MFKPRKGMFFWVLRTIRVREAEDSLLFWVVRVVISLVVCPLFYSFFLKSLLAFFTYFLFLLMHHFLVLLIYSLILPTYPNS